MNNLIKNWQIYKFSKVIGLLIYLFIGLFLYSKIAFSQTTTPSPNPSKNELPEKESDLENIQKIKNIVASKVAELDLVEKRGIIGVVSDVNKAKVVVIDIHGNSRNIDVDELTKFEFSEEKNSGISDLKKGMRYSFIGIYNKDSQRLLARNVDSTNTIPVHFEGAIRQINDDDFQIKIVNNKGEEKTIDIQNSTKTKILTLDGDLVKSGFSKLEVNTRILAIGFWDKNDNNTLSASRIIHFDKIPPSKQMQSYIKIEEN